MHFGLFRQKKIRPLFFTIFFACILSINSMIYNYSTIVADDHKEPLFISQDAPFADIRFVGYSEELNLSVNNLIFTVAHNPYFTKIVDNISTKTKNISINDKYFSNINTTDTIRLPEGSYYIRCSVPIGFDGVNSGNLEIEIDELGNVEEINGSRVLKDDETGVYTVYANLISTRKAGIFSESNREYELYIFTSEKINDEYNSSKVKFWKKYNLQEENLSSDSTGRTEPIAFMPDSLYKYVEKRDEQYFIFTFGTDSECNIINPKMINRTEKKYGRDYSIMISRVYASQSDPWANDGSVYFYLEERENETEIYRFVLP